MQNVESDFVLFCHEALQKLALFQIVSLLMRSIKPDLMDFPHAFCSLVSGFGDVSQSPSVWEMGRQLIHVDSIAHLTVSHALK